MEMVEEGVASRGLPLTLPLPPAMEGEEEGEGGVEGLQLLGVGVAEGDLVREERALGVDTREGLCVPVKRVVVEGEVARDREAHLDGEEEGVPGVVCVEEALELPFAGV